MAIKIIKPGMFSTIQDMGRNGYRANGIGPGGAMDFFAASVANFLVGNDDQCPVIEMHFPAAEMLFEEDALISITGADFGASINGTPSPLWQPFYIKKNETLSFKKKQKGARNYLGINGGIIADKWLNSYSTHAKVKAGGYKGRALLKGDSLQLNVIASGKPINNLPGFAKLISQVYQPSNKIRCIAGPEWQLLSEDAKTLFPQSLFMVTLNSDRMGYRLNGRNLSFASPIELISSPVDSGSIQLLPDGQLIVLMADHQTTGGYPRIANVITADLPKLAQSSIHSEIQFEVIPIETAEELLFSILDTLDAIKKECENFYANRYQL